MLNEENRQAWNAATTAHNSHRPDPAPYFRNGGSTLYPEEVGLLGDLAGKRVLHLQCNVGHDSLSLANLGAQVVGVDISDVAIDTAVRLSRASGLAAAFHRADVYTWLDQSARSEPPFDVAFSSYGR